MDQHPIIHTAALRKIYGMGDVAVAALDGVSIRIEPGEFVAIMGPSGSGKSTLMNILGCLDRPSEGQYVLDGEDVSNLNKQQLAAIRNRKLGFIFQSYNLLPRTTALKNVMLPLLYDQTNHRSNEERAEMALAALGAVGLADRVNHQPSEMSGGQKQRICIARALAAEPELIICDEVTSALDPLVADGILKLLLNLQKIEGVAYLFITHDLATVRAIADSIAVMYRGEVVRYGSKSDVLAPPFDDYTDLLLSSVPEMRLGWLEDVLKHRRMESAGN